MGEEVYLCFLQRNVRIATNGSNHAWNVAASLHRGGGVVARGDASVHFISDHFDLELFRGTCGISDGLATYTQ